MSVWRNLRNITHGPPKNVENKKCLRVVLRFVSALRHLLCFFLPEKKKKQEASSHGFRGISVAYDVSIP